MAKKFLVISGISPYDGEYPVDDSGFTNREYHYIKQVSGVRAGELAEAAAAGDRAVEVALTAITLQRNGKVVHLPLLWDAKDDCTDVRVQCDVCRTLNDADAKACVSCSTALTDTEEDADRPPTIATNGGNKSEPDVAEEPNSNSEHSGLAGTPIGEGSPNGPSPTGSPGLDGSESDRETSPI